MWELFTSSYWEAMEFFVPFFGFLAGSLTIPFLLALFVVCALFVIFFVWDFLS